MQNTIKNITKSKNFQRINTALFSPQKLPWTIISFGILVRLVQYLSNRSLWNDEAALALNIVNRSYTELWQPLDYDQGAPIGFLLVEKLAVQLFGDNEYALRLFPLLCAIASLFIFYYLAKRCLQPFAVPIALALFSSLHIIVYYATEVKQYASDVAIALVACLLLMQFKQKLTSSQILTYAVVGAILIWFSHPAIFVLAGISVGGCLVNIINQRKLLNIIAIGLIWALSFALFYLLTLQNIANKADLYTSWESRGTFPSSFLDVAWLFNTFVEFFHKPLGFPDVFLGIAIFAFFAGCVSLFHKQKLILILLLSPIIVTFLAAYLRKYPFDGRLVLFLTPFFILLVAEGVAFIRTQTNSRRIFKKLSLLILVLLLVPPIGTAAYLIVNPYQKQEIRPVIAYIKQQQQPGDTIYVYQRAEYQFKYYAAKFGYQDGDYVLGIDDLDKKDGQGISPEEWQRYARDLNQLRGKRAWIVFSHVRSWARESERITDYLDTFGKLIDSYQQQGSFAYLYDFKTTH